MSTLLCPMWQKPQNCGLGPLLDSLAFYNSDPVFFIRRELEFVSDNNTDLAVLHNISRCLELNLTCLLFRGLRWGGALVVVVWAHSIRNPSQDTLAGAWQWIPVLTKLDWKSVLNFKP